VSPADGPAVSSINLVLDTTAVVAYAAGSMDVHEPVIVAVESGERVAVPLACLLDAVRRNPKADVRELVHHPHVTIVLPADLEPHLLLDWTLYYGREDLAAAAVVSYQNGQCWVLTAEPDAYLIAGRRPHWIIDLDGSWQ
jgi:hypothetical protein